MQRASEVKESVKSSRGMCAGHAVFSHTKVDSESKIVRELLCFTIETAVGGREGRRRGTAVAAMVANVVAYARSGAPLGSEIVDG